MPFQCRDVLCSSGRAKFLTVLRVGDMDTGTGRSAKRNGIAEGTLPESAKLGDDASGLVDCTADARGRAHYGRTRGKPGDRLNVGGHGRFRVDTVSRDQRCHVDKRTGVKRQDIQST